MELTGKKILVTGGAGFLGSNLVDALIARSNQVTVLDDFSTGSRENLVEAEKTGRVNIVSGSIMDSAQVKPLVQDANVVFHLAAKPLRMCFERPQAVHEVNATGTLVLLQAIQEAQFSGLERFVYISSSDVYGTAKRVPMKENHELEPVSVYGASKLAGELYTMAYYNTYRLPAVILRPFSVYGYREPFAGVSGEVIPRFMVRILNRLSPVIFGDGSQSRDFMFVSDAVEGFIRTAEADHMVGQPVNIAYGQEVSIRDVAQMILSQLGQEDLGVAWEPNRPGDVYCHYADTTKLLQEVGFSPMTPIEEGLEQYTRWFQQQYPDPSLLLEQYHHYNWKLDTSEQLFSLPS